MFAAWYVGVQSHWRFIRQWGEYVMELVDTSFPLSFLTGTFTGLLWWQFSEGPSESTAFVYFYVLLFLYFKRCYVSYVLICVLLNV